ncbi:MAG TPA: SpoIIE family protein phosphatase, partial [Pilimelia sp.]|nr:SpoIIE family protein phosphatase [Pilimelia sp.]
ARDRPAAQDTPAGDRAAAPRVPPQPVAADSAATVRLAALARLPFHREMDEVAAELRRDLATVTAIGAVGLFSLQPDGSLRMAGAAGMPRSVTAEWAHIPAQLNTPIVDAVRRGRPRWLPDHAEARRRYVLLGEPAVVWPSRAALPLRHGDRIVGVAVVLCEEVCDFDPRTRRAVTRCVAEAAPRFVRLLRGRPEHSGWIADSQAILDLLTDATVLMVPVRAGDGRVVDFEVVAASPAAVDVAGRRGRDMVGLRTLRAYPALAEGELPAAMREVLTNGHPREVGPLTYDEVHEGIAVQTAYSVALRRFGEGLLVTWVRRDEERRYAQLLARLQRLGRLGWAEWDLTTDTVSWSDQLLAIFERDAAQGPIMLEDIHRVVLPADLPVVERGVADLLERRQPLDATFRVRLPGGIRSLRAIFEADFDARGRPRRAYGVVQDVSAGPAAGTGRPMLDDIERALGERRRALRTEHRLVAVLHQILLALPAGPVQRPGLEVGVVYRPAQDVARAGGDWYDVVPLPDDATLLAVGDVAGHGLVTAAVMAKLRHALAVLAVTSPDPGTLVTSLNRMVCADPTGPVGTVVVARYEPATARLTWAQAGHPPPILVSGGKARALPRPVGMLLGADPDARYAATATDLPADCRLLLYTDGLIERYGRRDLPATVLAALAGADREPVDALLARLRPANVDDDTCALALRPVRR